MNEKETMKKNEQETTLQEPHLKKQPPRYSHENKKENPKLNASQTRQRWPTGKKQRQQRGR
jgi:hypothetical protein